MAKILYLTYDGLTDSLGQSQILPYIIQLSKKGHSFVIISCEKRQNYKIRSSKIAAIIQKYSLVWYPLFYTKSPPIASTILDVISINRLAHNICVKSNIDIIHCRSYITSLVGLRMSRKHNVKFVFDMRGFWADERVDGGLWNLNNPIYKQVYKYFKNKEKQFVDSADQIISLTEAAKVEIKRWQMLNNTASSITVIPCCVDTNLFSPTKPYTSIDQQFTLLYVGSLGTWYMLDEMLDFFKSLKEKIPLSKFLFVTTENSANIIARAKEKAIDEIDIVVQKATRQEVPNYIQSANLAIFFIKPVYSKMASSPTKLGEILAMGIPIIANAGVGDISEYFKNEDIGLLINSFSMKEYEKVASKAISLSQKSGSKIRQVAIDKLSLQTGVDLYDTVYKNCLVK